MAILATATASATAAATAGDDRGELFKLVVATAVMTIVIAACIEGGADIGAQAKAALSIFGTCLIFSMHAGFIDRYNS